MELTKDEKGEHCVSVECRSQSLLRAMQQWMDHSKIKHSREKKYFSFVPNTNEMRAEIRYPKELFVRLKVVGSGLIKTFEDSYLPPAIAERIKRQVFESPKAKEICFTMDQHDDWECAIKNPTHFINSIQGNARHYPCKKYISLESDIHTAFRREVTWYHEHFTTITPSDILSATKFYKGTKPFYVYSRLISGLESVANDKKSDENDKVAMLMRLGDWLSKHLDIETEFKKDSDAYTKIRVLYETKLKPIAQILMPLQHNKKAFEIVKNFLLSRKGMFLVYGHLQHVPRLAEFLMYLAKHNFLTENICESAFENISHNIIGAFEFIEMTTNILQKCDDHERKVIIGKILSVHNLSELNRIIRWYERISPSNPLTFMDIIIADSRIKEQIPVISSPFNQRMSPESYAFFASLVKRELLTEELANEFPPKHFDIVIPFIKTIPENLLTKEIVQQIFALTIFLPTIKRAYELYQPRDTTEFEKFLHDMRFAQSIVRENKPRVFFAAKTVQTSTTSLFPAVDSRRDAKENPPQPTAASTTTSTIAKPVSKKSSKKP